MVLGMETTDVAGSSFLHLTGNPGPAFEYRVDVSGHEWIRQAGDGEGYGEWIRLDW